MPDESSVTVNPAGHRTEGAVPERRRVHVSRDEARFLAWLPWSSNGMEHGLKPHKIAKNGYVYETGDRPTESRRKSKAISSRQWRR